MDQITDKESVITGVMSGTSLDGLDLAHCSFQNSDGNWHYNVLKAETIAYGRDWKAKLEEAPVLSADAWFALNAAYGRFIGEQLLAFLKGVERPGAIASHGHTVFHKPALGYSTQLGCGATVAAVTGLTTVCDFRSLDVALGGQGAPLVPAGDKLLFGQYQACLNIGGIANISFDNTSGRRTAFDVCVANMALNTLAKRAGRDFDRDGELARGGTVIERLLEKLNNLEYYKQDGARSIGREWFNEYMEYQMSEDIPTSDLLATFTEHAAMIIGHELNQRSIKQVLVTGGGAYNKFLLERLANRTNCSLIIPDAVTIEFKEAIIFAFLGQLRLKKATNTFSSVTGAGADSIGGAVYFR
jgi:anhydro-N-acetylmuramic acid kinase